MKRTRRAFIYKAAATSGALLIGGCRRTPQNAAEASYIKLAPVNPGVPKRVEWSSLSGADQDAFIAAVTTMKNTTVPRGRGSATNLWERQAESHQFFCDHGTWFFLPWHRAYLYQFELTLRRLIRDDFRLPYWDWTVSGEIPAKLTNSPLLSTLGLTRRNNNVGTRYQSIMADINEFPDFDSIGGDSRSSGCIEWPHNSVHATIGGTMGSVALAGRDPLFWLHHCNVDRMWSMWMDDMIVKKRDSRSLFPSTDVETWLNHTFTDQFVTLDGRPSSFALKDCLFTEGMDYNYQGMVNTWEVSDTPGWRPTAVNNAVVVGGFMQIIHLILLVVIRNWVAAQAPQGLRLTGGPAENQSIYSIGLRFPDKLKTKGSGRIKSMRLRVSELPLPKDPSVTYVCGLQVGNTVLNLKPISFFGDNQHEKHGMGGAYGFDVTEYADPLQRSLQNSKEEYTIVIIAVDREGRFVSFDTAAKSFSNEKASISVDLKTVFT